MAKVIVTGYKKYDFENEQGRVKGCKVSYLSENLIDDGTTRGHLPMQTTINEELVQGLTEIPGIYDAEYDMVPGRNNKPTMMLVNLKLIKPLDLKKIVNA